MKKLLFLLVIGLLALSACGTTVDKESVQGEKDTQEETNNEDNVKETKDKQEKTEQDKSNETTTDGDKQTKDVGKKDDPNEPVSNNQEDTDKKEEVFDYTNVSFLPTTPSVFTFDTEKLGEISITFSESNDVEKFEKEVLIESNAWEYTDYHFEDKEGFYTSHGMEYSKSIAYPVEVGQSWVGYGEYPKYKIEAINVKVDTTYKTFENAVKVVSSDGYNLYYVPKYGLVKSEKVDENGNVTVLRNLKSVK